jgi:hypothetical protein
MLPHLFLFLSFLSSLSFLSVFGVPQRLTLFPHSFIPSSFFIFISRTFYPLFYPFTLLVTMAPGRRQALPPSRDDHSANTLDNPTPEPSGDRSHHPGDILQVPESQQTPSGPAKRTREDELHDLELEKARLEVERQRKAIAWEEDPGGGPLRRTSTVKSSLNSQHPKAKVAALPLTRMTKVRSPQKQSKSLSYSPLYHKKKSQQFLRESLTPKTCTSFIGRSPSPTRTKTKFPL